MRDDDRLKRYRRDHASWTLAGMISWCLEHGDQEQLEALTTIEGVLNELMRENAELRAAVTSAKTPYRTEGGGPLAA
jgi:hypothetical protein